MPGTPRKFDDESMRKALLHLITEGQGRKEACKELGVDYRTLYNYLKDKPDFRLEVEDAEGLIRETARKTLLQVMEHAERDADRVSAAKAVLSSIDREQKATTVEHTHRHELSAGPEVLEIVELQRQLQERQLMAGSIEGHVVDSEDD
jgi:hypothetical protein